MQGNGSTSFGVLIDNLGNDQKSYTIIRELNEASKNGYCPHVFFLCYDKPSSTPRFSLMQAEHAFYFPHPVIATSIETAKILCNTVLPPKKFYYLWNLDWLYYYDAEKEYRALYQHPDLNLISRSVEHARLVERCWLRKPFTVEDFNYERITKLF